jgi:predicted dehydrogenase
MNLPTRPVRVGVIGYGLRLQQVIGALRAATDQIEFSAVFDPSSAASDAFRAGLNPVAVVCRSAEELVSCDLDWVMIGSWNCQHADHAVAALEAGHDVFCEKPLALTIEDGLRIREAWRRSGRMFSLGFTLRYSPHYRKVHEIVAGGRLGRILSFEFNETIDFNHGGFIHGDWRRMTGWAGSHLLEKCCHDLDIANWMTGSRPRRVASFGGCDFFTPRNAGEIARLGADENGRHAFLLHREKAPRPIPGSVDTPFTADKDIVDNQVVILEYESGARATFHTNCLSAIPERRIVLCGTRGTLRADVLSGRIEVRQLGFGAETEVVATGAADGHGGGDEVQGQLLAASMLRGEAPLAGLEDGLSAAVAAFGADEALRTGQVVDLAPLWRRISGGVWEVSRGRDGPITPHDSDAGDDFSVRPEAAVWASRRITTA